MEDQDRHSLAEIRWRLPLRQQHVSAVELRQGEIIARHICGRDHAVGLQLSTERGDVEPGIEPVGLGDTQHQGMPLSRRPVRHVARPDVPREDLLPCHLCEPINAVSQRTGGAAPRRWRQQLLVEESGVGRAVEWREKDAGTGNDAGTQHLAPRGIKCARASVCYTHQIHSFFSRGPTVHSI